MKIRVQELVTVIQGSGSYHTAFYTCNDAPFAMDIPEWASHSLDKIADERGVDVAMSSLANYVFDHHTKEGYPL